MLIVRDVGHDGLAGSRIGPQPLGSASAVARDHTISGIENGLRRTVVLLQQHSLGIGVVALELLDVADGRPPEGVDRLVGVTDDAEFARGDTACAVTDQLTHKDVLSVVGVLVLIHEDVTEPAPIVLGHIGEELEQRHGRADEIVEVKGVCTAEPALVLRIRLRQDPIRGGLRPTSEGLLIDEFVFQVRDPRREAAGRVALGVEIEILDDHRHQPLRVGGVVD